MPELLEQPRIEPWMKPEDITFRNSAVTHLHTAADIGLLPGSIEGFGVFPTGESSVVFKLDSNNGPFVVKMTPTVGVVETEAGFFSRWKEQGVKTPEVLAVHTANDTLPVSISVLEFIDAPLLGDTIRTKSRVALGISREMGRTQALMHKAKGIGFGHPIFTTPTHGSLTSFSEEMAGVFAQRTELLISKGIIGGHDLEMASRATAIIEKDLAAGVLPALTHNDFRPYNILATSPITVIDPNSRITHPAMCLSQSLLKALVESSGYGKQEFDEILTGYREISKIDDNILAAATILRSILTLHTWVNKGQEKKVGKLITYMREKQNEL